MEWPVQAGIQAGKHVLIGMVPASEIVNALKNGVLSINQEAQRSLAKGAGKEPTKDLLANDRVHKTPRMVDITKFFSRVMDKIEKGDNTEGFFGAVQLIVPEAYEGAKLYLLKASEEERARNSSLDRYLDALVKARVGTFVAKPGLGEVVIHIVDGQGRCVGFYSFERAVTEAIETLKTSIRKLEKSYKSADREKEQLEGQEALLKRIRKFLSSTHVPFVLYADSIAEDGRVAGLPVVAERRLYIEGNALNAQAAKEEILKFESFSPVVVLLQWLRVDPDFRWMSADVIEEDSKSIGATSSKVFTLSALAQAFSFSAVGHNQPIKRVDKDMFNDVGAREDFVREYWREISRTLEPLWAPEFDTAGERIEYLKARRGEQHVAFTGIFLQALGKLGYALGARADWDSNSPLLMKVRKLDPEGVSYAAQDADAPDGYDPVWRNAMMKPVTDKETGEITKYVFNNVTDSVDKAFRVLAATIGLDLNDEASDEDGTTVVEDTVEEWDTANVGQ
jgi:hypothetical protein